MKRDDANSVRELTDNEMTSVSGGEVIGAIPGYTPPPLPAGLFVTSATCVQAFSPTGEFYGGVCWNNY